MHSIDLSKKITELEADLIIEQQEYTRSIESHESYTHLRAIRDKIHEKKLQLQELYTELNHY